MNLDAERQAAGSNLKLTTTVQPAAVAPVMQSGTTITTNENTPIGFMPAGVDYQGYTIYVVVNTLPANGTLQASVTNPSTGATTLSNVVIGNLYSLTNTTFIYSPTYMYYGSTTMSYYGTNLRSAAPSPNMVATINTAYVNRKSLMISAVITHMDVLMSPSPEPPVPVSSIITVYSNINSYIPVSAVDPEGLSPNTFTYSLLSPCVNGLCILPCVTAVSSSGTRIGDCIPGLTAAANSTQKTWLKYTPYNLGSDTAIFSVFDGAVASTVNGTVSMSVICNHT